MNSRNLKVCLEYHIFTLWFDEWWTVQIHDSLSSWGEYITIWYLYFSLKEKHSVSNIVSTSSFSLSFKLNNDYQRLFIYTFGVHLFINKTFVLNHVFNRLQFRAFMKCLKRVFVVMHVFTFIQLMMSKYAIILLINVYVKQYLPFLISRS